MRHFSQREEASYLCYHARLRAGTYIWEGEAAGPLRADGLNLLVRLSLFPKPGNRTKDTPAR